MRAWSSRELHAVGWKFQHDRMERDLTFGQEWLYDAIVSELEWRRAQALKRYGPFARCSCELCFNPFED